MPAPIATYQTLRFLWSESKPVRDWLWSKLPSVRDSKRREQAEEKLAKLLDDANALAQAIPQNDLEPKIDERIERFRQDLLASKLPPEEADLLTERATMFVRLLVTGPFADLVALRSRLAVVEDELARQEKRIEQTERRAKEAEATNHALERLRHHFTLLLIVGPLLLFATILIIVVLLRP